MANEDKMLEVWRAVFVDAEVDEDSDFFDLGGNSMHAVTLIARIQRDFGAELPFVAVWDAGTPRRMAQLIEAQR